MTHLIIPWIATFLFGCAVFIVGRVFQSIEKRQRAQRKAEAEREALAKAIMQQHVPEERSAGLAAALGGQGQGKQHGGRLYN